MPETNGCIYGYIAEFEDSESLLEAAHRTREAGFRRARGHSPYYVEGLADALGDNTGDLIAWYVLGGILLGGVAFFLLQFITGAVWYPLNIGARPIVAWQAWMIITFEGSVLGGGLAALLGLVLQIQLPLPYHPIFNAPDFHLASSSRFFLSIEARDPLFDEEGTWQFLESLEPTKVSEVTC
ncbi:MAG: DUF3341 domain-containing protein [Chloroflexi bacterium]|nr:DUF3341 domain-containing protein [Chloroflexota bacterium]